MILPKKDNENSSKPKLSKESFNKIHNSENVSHTIFVYRVLLFVNVIPTFCFVGGKRR